MILAVVYGVYTLFFAAPREEFAFKSGGGKELDALKARVAAERNAEAE